MKVRHLLAAVVVLTASGIAAGAEPSSAAVVTATDIARTVRQLSRRFTDDEPLRVLDAGSYRVGVFVVGRPKKIPPAPVGADGAVAVTEGLQLDEVSAVLEVLSGAGEFVTGGTLADPSRMRADDPDASVIGPGNRGKAIIGGQRQRIARGDVVIIPAGVPHGFAATETPITYLVIRIDIAHSLPLR